MVFTSENLRRMTLRVDRIAAVTPTQCSEAEEAEHAKCGLETQAGRTSGAGRAVRTSGGTGLWKLGKTQLQLCSTCFCHESGESQLSSIIRTIEGRNYRIKIKKRKTTIKMRPEEREQSKVKKENHVCRSSSFVICKTTG